ncbi:MAG: MlaD family protein [Spirochaetia bacterium]|nr:MlaD family protein [Spirochaetia bacterium]
MGTSRNTAIYVGLMVVIGAIIFITSLAILARWRVAAEGFSIDLQFSFLNNLSEGASVKVSGGIPVGYVKSIYQKDMQTYVKLYLNNDLRDKIPKRPETQFGIYTTGLMGQKFINITIPPAQEGDEFIQPGDVYKGIDPPSIDQMLMVFSSWFDGKSGGQVLAEIMQETERFISNLNAIASENRQDIRLTIKQARESFSNLSDHLDILMKKLNILSENFSDISTKNKQDIQIMLENMSQISKDLNLITQRINSGRGSVGKFIADENIYENTNEAIENAKELFKLLKEKPWLMLYKE